VFRGCYSHNNIDDGWDLYTKSETGAIDPVVIDQCIASGNGTLTSGISNAAGDRNGFKLGGEKIAVAHKVTRCVAFSNGKNGFTWNSNPGAIALSNCLAYDNAEGNYKFGDNSTQTQAVFSNNISFWTSTANHQSDKAVGTDAGSSNCWWDKSKTPPSVNAKGLLVTAADFALALGNPTIRRNSDNSLDFNCFRLAAGSDLIDAGVAAGLPYSGKAPDLGVIEFGFTGAVLPDKNSGHNPWKLNCRGHHLQPGADIFSLNGRKINGRIDHGPLSSGVLFHRVTIGNVEKISGTINFLSVR
jgi:hypothetical protein